MSGYRAKKRFGQNFLKSPEIIKKIVRAVNPQPNEQIIEIGAGRGAITYPLAESGAHITAIEFDNDLIGYLTKLLSKFSNTTIIHTDFLLYQPEFAPYKLIGNLPYNITSPVIEWACKNKESITSAYFMTQKEVALRISATPDNKDWSPLAIFTQLYFEIDILFHISAEHFSPPPKVESSLIKLTPKKELVIEHREEFEEIVRAAFVRRRKTLLNNLSESFEIESEELKKVFEECAISEKVRAEQISIENFLKLTNLFVKYNILSYKN